jgi:hypothetical protein
MNFIFMIILILIILLFFNIYLKQIPNSFYTTLLLFVLIINELYFTKMEKFQSIISQPVDIPAFPEYRLDYDFKQHMNKQMCLFNEQSNLIKTNSSINTNCHKISNRTSCDMYRECEYDTEYNRCNEKSNCNNIVTEPLKCHYMDNQETCETLSKKIPKCDIYNNKKECNKHEPLCEWDLTNNKCEYKENTCIKLEKDQCSENPTNCKWKYYSDIYNSEPKSETNIRQCHSLNKLDMAYTEGPWSFDSLDDLNDKLYEVFYESKYDNIDFYGINKTKLGTYYLYLLTINNLDTISGSIVSNHKCLTNNTYLGNEDHIMIYKRNGECKTIKKCKWEIEDTNNNVCYLQNESHCLEDSNCFYNYKTEECNPKGICKDAPIVEPSPLTPTPATTRKQPHNSNRTLAFNYTVAAGEVRRDNQSESNFMGMLP